jgi:Rrf2 family protein
MSQKCEYGLRILLELTGRQGDGPVSVSEIAILQAIPQRFLELIIKELREAGVVSSRRGARGGYTLACDPQDLTVGRIVRLLDGSLNPMDCKSCGGDRRCAMHEECVFAELWQQAEATLGGLYDSVCFAELHRRRGGNGNGRDKAAAIAVTSTKSPPTQSGIGQA